MGLGISELLILAVLGGLALVFSISRGRRMQNVGPALAISKFDVNESGPGGVYVEIIGRPSGLLSWMLTSIGFDTETTLRVTDDGIHLKSSSLFGQVRQEVTHQSISSTQCGYAKSFWFLVGGVAFGILALAQAFKNLTGSDFFGAYQRRIGTATLILGLIAIVLLLVYWFSRKLLISCETSGGSHLGITMKPSMIEHVSVSADEAQQVIKIISRLVVNHQMQRS